MKEDKTLLDKMLDEFPDATPVPATTVQPKAKPSKIKRLFKGLGVIALGLGMAFGAKTIYDRYTGPQTDKPPIVDVDDQKANQLSDGTEQSPLPEVDYSGYELGYAGDIRIPEDEYGDFVHNLVDVNIEKWEDILSKYVVLSNHDEYLRGTKLDYIQVKDNYLYFYITSRGNTGYFSEDVYEYRTVISYELSPNNAKYIKENTRAFHTAECVNYILNNYSGKRVSQLNGTMLILDSLDNVATELPHEAARTIYKVYGGIKDKDKILALLVDLTGTCTTAEIEIANAVYDNSGCLTDFRYGKNYDFDSAFKNITSDFDYHYSNFLKASGITGVIEVENN